MVDTKYTFEAEGQIRLFCKSFKKNLKTDGYNELIVLDHEEHDMVKNYYGTIGSKYAGATAELQKEVLVLKDQIRELEHKNDIQREQMEKKMMEKDYMLERVKTQLETTVTIYELKLQLSNIKKN